MEPNDIWIVRILRSFATYNVEHESCVTDSDETRTVFPSKEQAFAFARKQLKENFCIDYLEIYTYLDEMIREEH